MAEFTENFSLINSQQTKKISIVLTIDGLATKLSNRPTYAKIRYGDPDIVYGMPGLVYGGLRRLDSVLDYISLDSSSLTLSQRLEPEQGKGSVSTLTFAFIDRNNFMTQILSPGMILDEILGREVTVELGYEELSYPEDYFVVFRGFISQVEDRPGLVIFQLSDSNMKRRQTIFYSAATKLSLPITNVATTIPVVAAGDFHQKITGPFGGTDPGIKTYIKIDDEFIEYPIGGIVGNDFVTVTRGARGSTAVAHAADADVFAYVQIQDHAIDVALKLMLSGWNGDWLTNATVSAFVDTGLALVPNAIIFPEGVDVIKDYGFVLGDRITTTGATNPANNVTRAIIDIQDIGDQPNRVIVVDGAALAAETLTSALLASRSQYDTYPISCGMKLTPREVDVQGHLNLKTTFLSSPENSYRFLINASTNGKSFIESEVYLPVSAYSVTRRGQLSVRITQAALASVGLIFLNEDNILNATTLAPKRAINTRKFFNDIVIQYDKDDAGDFNSVFRVLDSDSLNLIGITSTLPINSSGIKSALAVDTPALLQRRANFLLTRYKRGAVEITVRVNFGTGVQIEAGDVVALDGTNLQIANFDTGTRDFGVQLFEVVNRTIDLRNGVIDLALVAGVGASVNDRFATISPSSNLTGSSTSSIIEIEDSYSAANPVFPANEPQKWENYIGQRVAVHSEDFSVYEETTFVGFVPGNNYQLNLSPPLSFMPPAGYVLNIPRYPTDTDPIVDSIYKAVHAHIDPTVLVTTASSDTQFDVSPSDAAKFVKNLFVMVHDVDYTDISPEVKVTDITGNTITVSPGLGFTPSSPANTRSLQMVGGKRVDFGFLPFDFDRTDPFTFSVWIKVGTDAGNQDILSKEDPGGGNAGYDFVAQGIGGGMFRFVWNFSNTVGVNWLEFVSSGSFPINTWMHVSLVMNGGTFATSAIYVNGVSIPLTSLFDSLTLPTVTGAAANFFLGYNPTSPGFDYIGNSDQLMVTAAALNPTEALELYNLFIGTGNVTTFSRYADVISYYPIGEGADDATTIYDNKNGFDGAGFGLVAGDYVLDVHAGGGSSIDYLVEFIGFLDGGGPYRLI